MPRVATWNLWWRFGPWEARQAAIAGVLAAEQPDVIGLQEVWVEENGINQASALAERLGLYAAVGDLRFHNGLAFTNAVLSRWPIAESVSQPLPGLDGGPSHRNVLGATVDAPFGRFVFASTHLDYRFDASATRQAQTAAVAEFMAERRNDPATGYPAVLVGDFNAIPTSDEIRILTGEKTPAVAGLVFTDAWSTAGDGSPGHTWHSANPYLTDATWPNRRLDYIFVSWPRTKPAGTAIRCWTAGREPIDGVVASDHYAVVADLAVPATL